MGKGDNRYMHWGSLDAQEDAEHELNKVLGGGDVAEDLVIYDEELKAKQEQKQIDRLLEEEQKKEALIDVKEALKEEKVLHEESQRQAARMLIITRNKGALTDGSAAQKYLENLGGMFSEVHVVVLCERGESALEPDRIRENVWVYPTNSDVWWKEGFDAYRVALEQLYFNNIFRVDLVIVEDPFEAGLAGLRLARKFGRPLQIHINEDYFSDEFVDREPYNNIRVLLMKYVLPRAACIRTKTEALRSLVLRKFPEMKGRTEAFPTYYNLNDWKEAKTTTNLKEEYPQFKFIMLHVTSMTPESHSDRVLVGVKKILHQYSTVGLIIVGDGPGRHELEGLAKQFGVEEQAIFLGERADVTSLMRTANVLIHASESPEEEHFVLQGAVAGVPMIVGESSIVEELFKDGESVFVCPLDSPPCFERKVNRLLNENNLRTRLSRAAHDIVFERVEQDVESYQKSYKYSLEHCLFEDS